MGLLNASVLNRALEQLSGIDTIQLNSAGGEFYSSSKVAALKFAEKIREHSITTSLREGAYCGSLCTLIYQAGAKRLAHQKSDLMYHGPQWQDKARELDTACYSKNVDQENCEALKNEITALNDEFFGLLENYGASAQLKARYMAQPRDEGWYGKGNLMQVEDLFLSAEAALSVGAVTEVIYQ